MGPTIRTAASGTFRPWCRLSARTACRQGGSPWVVGGGLARATTSRCQRVEQRLGPFQNGRVEALCEPAVDRCQKIAGGIALALLAPESGKTDSGAQLPELRALLL